MSLLALAWRRRQNKRGEEDHLYNHHRTFSPRHPLVAPALIESHSSDASTEMPLRDNRREEFICIPRRQGAVVTPEGLKPRRSMVDLRDELMLDTAELLFPKSTKKELSTGDWKISEIGNTAIVPVSNDLKKALVPVPKVAEQAIFSTSWKMSDTVLQTKLLENEHQFRLGSLPPLPIRSWSTDGAWSTPTPDYSPQNGSWPQSSSERSSWGTTPSAESPNLVPGRARTAVGHLVALQQDPPGTTPVHNSSNDWVYSPQEDSVETMFSPMFSRTSAKDLRKTYPLPHIAERGEIAGMNHVQGRKAITYSKGQEKGTETMCSPMCSNKKSSVEGNDNRNISTIAAVPGTLPVFRTNAVPLTTTLITSAALLSIEHDTEVILSQKHLQSGSWTADSSNGSTATKRVIKSSDHRVAFADDNSLGLGVDENIQHTKARNQRHTKEELFFSAFERLQDDVQLVADVEGLLGTSRGMFDWFVPTPLDEESLLTGFSEARRLDITMKMELLTKEISSEVKSHEYFLNSSTVDISEYQDDTHDDLHQALSFCTVLVQMAVPQSEKEESSLQGTNELGKWRFLPGMREAIGLLSSTAETPPARGGDSSFFSLPTDDDIDTPMTSNVSLGASTLTSVTNNGMSPTTPHNLNALRMKLKQQNGLHLRQAIQLLSTGLQKLTKACLAFSAMDAGRPSGLVRAAEQIKKTYFQMLGMSQRDLKSVVDAFEFELDAEDSYVYEDSDEAEGDSPVMRVSTLGFGTIANVSVTDDMDSSYETGPISPPRAGDQSSADIDDSAAATNGFFDFDDLRRQMGSNDYDEQVEERDGAPEDVYAMHPTSGSFRSGKSSRKLHERCEF